MEKTFIEINSFKEKNSFTKKSRKKRYKCLSKPLIFLSIIVSQLACDPKIITL